MDLADRVMAAGNVNIKAITCWWTTLIIATAITFAQDEAPRVEVGISDDLVHQGNEASVTCRVQNQGSHKISIEKHVKIRKENYIDVVALGDSLVDKYEKLGRFSVRKLSLGSNALYILDMRNVSYRDTAKYVCKALGSSGRDHANFMVYKPPATVEFDKFQEGDIITFKEGMGRHVSCTAFQSAPIAEISFKVGQKIQKGSKPKIEESLAKCFKRDESKCLLHYTYNTKAKVTNLVAEAEDDGAMLRCEAEVQGSEAPPISTQIEISVLYSPKIFCEYNHTTYSRVQYEVSCTVKSNPAPISLKWSYSGDPTVKGATEVKSGYKIEDAQVIYSTHKERNEKEHEVTLHIPQVLPHHFTTFTLNVVNIVGNSSSQIILTQAEDDVGSLESGAAFPGVSSRTAIFVILSLTSLLCIACCTR